MLDYISNVREIENKIGSFMEEDAEKGHFRVARDIFTDPDLFELEMKCIWEGNWLYLAHETQIPSKNDYFTMYMGRQPIFIARNLMPHWMQIGADANPLEWAVTAARGALHASPDWAAACCSACPVTASAPSRRWSSGC